MGSKKTVKIDGKTYTVADHDDKQVQAASLAGRNDLLPENSFIPSPYARSDQEGQLSADADADDVKKAIADASGANAGEGQADGTDGSSGRTGTAGRASTAGRGTGASTTQ